MVGHALAKLLGIKLQDPRQDAGDLVTRGESVLSAGSRDSFVEGPPTTSEWLNAQIPSPGAAARYAKSLFPFLPWIRHYNLQWLAGDVVAGMTIGAVVVPQGMAYASLAKLEPQFGLYSSFMGVILYWIFGTSKDISIGPVAVLSTVVGSVVDDVTSRPDAKDIPPHVIASALSVIAGCVVLAIGLLRCGWIVDLISITSLSAFMTGSAITIAVSQLPALLGVTGFSNRDPPYKVVINTLKHLPHARLDAVMGLTALFALYLVRYGLAKAAERYPRQRRAIFFVNTMRTVVVIVLYTLVSWLVNMHRRDNPAFRLLGTVPKGFRHAGVPQLQSNVVSHFGSHLPATVIVMLVEHIAISKSFGRVNDYSIDPSQEMVAIGVTNMLGPFLGAYPSTGSFSRTAVNSKAGVRTPAGGLVSGLVVLLATYLLTAVFFYIPNATLSAVIIHAVGDLITPPNTVYQFWRVSPLEVFVFFVVGISAAILIYRILKARGRFLGKVRVHSVLGDHVIGDDPKKPVGEYGTFEEPVNNAARNVFLPLDHEDGSNPEVEVDNPYPGIFIYRFFEGFNYPNANFSLDYLTDFIIARTCRTSPERFERAGDRPWNNPGPRKTSKSRADSDVNDRPTLKAIILDFSSVNNVDITSVQRLIDVRNQLDQYASPDVVDWHIACINNRWTKRALVAGGFGVPTGVGDGTQHRWKSIFSVAEIGGRDSAAAVAEENANARQLSGPPQWTDDEQMGKEGEWTDFAAVHGLDMPLFHVDLTSAVQSAIANVEARHEFREALEAEVVMPWGIQRLNARKSQPNPNIVFIKPLAGPSENVAQGFLERIAAQCVPVMRKHQLYVMSLEEYEPNHEFVGRNFNAGEVIQLVLKSPHTGHWLPFEYVQMVMMHELAHCKQMNHSRAFWAVRNGYAAEMHKLWTEGYAGEGIWGRGANLRTGEWERDTIKADEVLPEHLCGGTFRTRGRKRKRKPVLTYQERKERRIRKRFGESGVALGADEETKVKLEQGKRTKAKPRVANSDRGRQLRAAAALARFEKPKEETASIIKDDDDTGSDSEDGDENAQDVDSKDAVDVDGRPLVDSKGRGMVRVCEDEDTNDVDARGELDELRDVFRKGRIKRESPGAVRRSKGVVEDSNDARGRQGRRNRLVESKPRPRTGVKSEATEDSVEVLDAAPAAPPDARTRAKTSQRPSPTVEGRGDTTTCPACSFVNVGPAATCGVCANVLDTTKTGGTWRCGNTACTSSSYANSGDCGVCGLCGQRRGEGIRAKR
ncbi:sulfate permease family domain-containing protein [Hirsutella rhossiliensis]|uniref:Sulfate permease family domain-containing protein n=1 Tax=Hirsutella rhossiliensis TaxID=111463 RepID=A0A9P8SLU3_9HYPO|nr:sulfate permease family domain-containing protein [Hirsutella rhossiliensis]KAH0967306.1 sulfate permease family domain-containing protein [Hirsutella rhossiliensis]